MPTFVAVEGDVLAQKALQIINSLPKRGAMITYPISTRVLCSSTYAEPGEIALFTLPDVLSRRKLRRKEVVPKEPIDLITSQHVSIKCDVLFPLAPSWAKTTSRFFGLIPKKQSGEHHDTHEFKLWRNFHLAVEDAAKAYVFWFRTYSRFIDLPGNTMSSGYYSAARSALLKEWLEWEKTIRRQSDLKSSIPHS